MIRPVRSDGRIETGGVFRPVPRPRVAERLAAAALHHVALIIAPAGFGKSIALHEFLREADVPTVRFDVRPDHADLRGFLRGFAIALERVAPQVLLTLPGAYERSRSSPTPVLDLAHWLCAHLEGFRGIVAVDDMHVTERDPDVCALLVELVNRTPDSIHWIIASRSWLHFPVASWMAYGRMELAVDEQDLRCTLDEARAIARASRVAVRDDELRELLALTDGWPTALAFALRTSTRSSDLRAVAAATREMIFRYLAEQVYGALDEREREFLEFAALLPAVDVRLLERAGYDDACALIERLRVRTSLIIPDEAGNRFVCHDLFREFLHHRLLLRGEAAAMADRARAAWVLEAGDDVVAALDLYAQACSEHDVVRLLNAHGLDLMERGYADAVERAIAVLPDRVLRAEPTIVAIRGLLALHGGDEERAERFLRRVVESDGEPALRARIALRLAAMRINRSEDAAPLLERVIADTEVGEDLRAEAYAVSAVVAARRGDARGARDAAERALEHADRTEHEDVRARLLQRAGVAFLESGEVARAKAILESAVEAAQRAALYSVASRAYTCLALIAHLHEGDPEAQVRHAVRAEECALRAGDIYDVQIALLHRLDAATLRGDKGAMEEIEREVVRITRRSPDEHFYLRVARAERDLWEGHFDRAAAALSALWERVPYLHDRARCAALLSLCFAVIDRSKEAGEMVRQALATLEQSSEAHYTGTERVETFAYSCIAEGLCGRGTGMHRLMTALRREPDAFARMTADAVAATLDVRRNPLLHEALAQSAVDRLRAAGYGGPANVLAAVVRASARRVETERRTPLTAAELRVLDALARGLTPKEIAAESGRSVYTIQAHIQNAIGKLGCRGRVEAIATARRLGYLEA